MRNRIFGVLPARKMGRELKMEDFSLLPKLVIRSSHYLGLHDLKRWKGTHLGKLRRIQ